MTDLYWVEPSGDRWAVRADENFAKQDHRTVDEFDRVADANAFAEEMNGFADILTLYGEQMGEGD